MTKFLNISTDNTLGGNSPSDDVVSSQKAVQEYVDSHAGGSANIDNKSITKNSSDELQTVGVINSRDNSTAVKTWTGTKAQYDAIVTKDANTLYNITDDTDVTLTLLEALYPVGSVYETTNATCPLTSLISGSTWVQETSRTLVDKGGTNEQWWELYSDGWCRQGGQHESVTGANTITFDKAYVNVPVISIARYSSYTGSVSNASYWGNVVNPVSNTSFSVNVDTSKGKYFVWTAEGYTSTTTSHKRFRRTA